MKRLLIYLGIALFFTYCTPQQRLSRLVKRHPHLAVTKYVEIHDTFIRPGTKADSSFKLKKKTVSIQINSDFDIQFDSAGNLIQDTVELSGDQYQGKVIIHTTGNIDLRIQATCKTIKPDSFVLKGKGFTTKLALSEDSASLETAIDPDTGINKINVPVQEINPVTPTNFQDILLYIFLIVNTIFLFWLMGKYRKRDGQA